MVAEGSSKKRQRKPTAVTGLQIAEYLAKNPRGARLGDVAAALKMDPGQTHRLINAMMEDGWVTAVSDNGHYALTARVIGLGAAYTTRMDLFDHAQSFLEDLFQKTGESVFLGELRGDVVVCVGRRLADRQLQVWTEVGKSWPLVGTAVGSAIRAAKAERLQLGLSTAKLGDDVANALVQGYARDSGRHRDGVECVAATIRNASGDEVGTISIGVPAARVGEKEIEKLGSLVYDAAAGVSERLGWVKSVAPAPASKNKPRRPKSGSRVGERAAAGAD